MLKKLIRAIHTMIVMKYIPNDNEPELAEALFNWRHKINNS